MNTEWCKNKIQQAAEQADNTAQKVVAYDQKHNSILTVIGLTAVIAAVAGGVVKVLFYRKPKDAKSVAKASQKKFNKELKQLLNTGKDLTSDQYDLIKKYANEVVNDVKDKAEKITP